MGIHTTTNSNDQNAVICVAHKRLKDVATRCVLRAINASKCVCSRGSAMVPTGGAYSAPQTPYLDLWGTSGEGKGERKKVDLLFQNCSISRWNCCSRPDALLVTQPSASKHEVRTFIIIIIISSSSSSRWLGGVTVKASNLRSSGREFDSWSGHY